MCWQPIETAPRDGTDILIAFKGGRIASSYWWKRELTGVSGWRIGGSLQNDFKPTHWMPLPPPPEE